MVAALNIDGGTEQEEVCSMKFSSAATQSSKRMWPQYTCKQLVHLLLLEEAAQWLDALSSSVAACLQESMSEAKQKDLSSLTCSA